MRISKSAILLTAATLALGVSGVATASAAAPAKPKAYGACVSTKTGAMRLLEPNRLRKSQHGRCKSSERKIYLPTREAIPAPFVLPAKFTISLDGVKGTCTRGADVAGVPDYACAKATPTPTPTVTVTATPTPTRTS
ncbi:hypothetical protein ACFXJ8_25930 [Nonomuraea sp. NPDC059194]|uniref:hypothetical protein n=1 Tax=Nonomuraea sp. NPDC059194 TaxID=3346764 RepID=UPI0036A005E0